MGKRAAEKPEKHGGKVKKPAKKEPQPPPSKSLKAKTLKAPTPVTTTLRGAPRGASKAPPSVRSASGPNPMGSQIDSIS